MQRGGMGNALRVVAAGIGDDTGAALLLRQSGQGSPSAAELEAAGDLQTLGLDPDTPFGHRIKQRRTQQRCLAGAAHCAACCGADHVNVHDGASVADEMRATRVGIRLSFSFAGQDVTAQLFLKGALLLK